MAALSSADDYKGALNKILFAIQSSSHGIEPEAWLRAGGMSEEHKLQVLSEYETYRLAKGSRINPTHTEPAID